MYEENWIAVQLFLACQTQWNVSGMGGVIGFNYTAVEAVMRIHAIDDKLDAFQKLQIMESEALKLMNEKSKK